MKSQKIVEMTNAKKKVNKERVYCLSRQRNIYRLYFIILLMSMVFLQSWATYAYLIYQFSKDALRRRDTHIPIIQAAYHLRECESVSVAILAEADQNTRVYVILSK